MHEATLIIMLASVAAPVLVWAVLGGNPGTRSVIGSGAIFVAPMVHTMWRCCNSAAVPQDAAA